MPRLRLALTSWSIAGALFAIAPCLHAQEANASVAAWHKADAPAGAVRVFITTDEDDLLLTVAQPGEQLQGIVRCYHRCSFWGLPGSYTLWATSPERDFNYETTLHVEKRAAFRVSSGHPAARTAGLVTGIVGPIVMVSGVVVLFAQVIRDPAFQCNESNCPQEQSHPLGVVMFWGGLLATPIGWGIFGAGGPSVHKIHESRMRASKAAAARTPPLQLGVLAFPHGGWGVGVSTLF